MLFDPVDGLSESPAEDGHGLSIRHRQRDRPFGLRLGSKLAGPKRREKDLAIPERDLESSIDMILA